VAVNCKSVNCNPLTPLLRFVIQLVSTVDKISTDLARRAVSVSSSRLSCLFIAVYVAGASD